MTETTGLITKDMLRRMVLYGALEAELLLEAEAEQEQQLYLNEDLFLYPNESDVLTYQNLPLLAERLAMELDACLRVEMNSAQASERWRASLHAYRERIDLAQYEFDFNLSESTPTDVLDQAAQQMGFRSWDRIPLGALDRRWTDPDPYMALEDEDWTNLLVMMCTAMQEERVRRIGQRETANVEKEKEQAEKRGNSGVV